METSELCDRRGTTCATLADCGRSDCAKVHVWVDLMVFPSGRWMVSEFVSFCILVTGAPGKTKWLVAPASAMAWSIAILMPLTLNKAFSELQACS